MAEIRKGFLLRLKPGALEQYVHWHDNIWPELAQEIADQGIAEVSLWNIDDMVILTSRVKNENAWQRLWDTDIHKRWGELMSQFMPYREDGTVDSREMTEIWHFVPGGK